MHVLVTGGAGFIGSELVRQLAGQDVRVTVVDNLINGKHKNLESVLGPEIQLVVADIRDENVMAQLLSGIDVVFHLACIGVRHSVQSPIETHEVNSSATLAILLTSRQQGVKRFVYVSSSAVYGTSQTVPITENHPTFPTTVYGASKLAGECYTRAFWETYRFPTLVVRLFHVYGPGSRDGGNSGDVIGEFMLRSMAGKPVVIPGDDAQTRDFTFVSDAARGILASGFSEHSVGHTFNLGSGKELQIGELAHAAARVLGKNAAAITDVESRPGQIVRFLADTSKAKKLLDFNATVPLEQGLARLRDWFVQQETSPLQLLEDEAMPDQKPWSVPSHA